MPYFKSNFFCISISISGPNNLRLVGGGRGLPDSWNLIGFRCRPNAINIDGLPSYCFGSQDGQGPSLWNGVIFIVFVLFVLLARPPTEEASFVEERLLRFINQFWWQQKKDNRNTVRCKQCLLLAYLCYVITLDLYVVLSYLYVAYKCCVINHFRYVQKKEMATQLS